MAVVLCDDSGRIELGIFFEVYAYPSYDFCRDFAYSVYTFSERESYVYAEPRALQFEKDASGWCPLHPAQMDIFRLRAAEISLGGGGSSEFIGQRIDDPGIYVRADIADAILARKFTNARFIRTTVIENESLVDESSLMAMSFDGRTAWRAYSVKPPEANVCIKCGFKPMVCTVCDTMQRRCPQCDESGVIIRTSAGKSNIPANASLLERIPPWRNGRIIDLRRWDGNDFLYPHIVTGRVVDVLLSFNPSILCARALRCYVGDAKPELYELLRSRRFMEKYGSDVGYC